MEREIIMNKQEVIEQIKDTKKLLEGQLTDKHSRLEAMIDSLRSLIKELNDEDKQKAFNIRVDSKLSEVVVQLDDLKII